MFQSPCGWIPRTLPCDWVPVVNSRDLFLQHPSLVLSLLYLTSDLLEPACTGLWKPRAYLLQTLCLVMSSWRPEIGPGGIFTPWRSPSATNQVVVVFVEELVVTHLPAHHFLTCSSWHFCPIKCLPPRPGLRSTLSRIQTKRSTYLLQHFDRREKHMGSHLRITRRPGTW